VKIKDFNGTVSAFGEPALGVEIDTCFFFSHHV